MLDLAPIKLVLSLIDPDYPQSLRLNELITNRSSLKAAMRFARDNGLYYCLMLKLKEANLALPPREGAELDKERQRLAVVKKTILLLNNISREAGIDYILIKACTTIPHTPRDIDILVHSRDKERVCQALEYQGMRCLHSSGVETSLTKEGCTDIDVYTVINYVTLNFIDDAFLWEARIEDEIFGVRCPSLNNEANFLLMLVHSLFGHRRITLLDWLHLRSLMTGLDMDVCHQQAQQKGWGTTLELALGELDTLHRRIYERGEVIPFPYLFSRNFILGCLSAIDGLRLKKGSKAFLFLHLSLLADRVLHELTRLPFYSSLVNLRLARDLVNGLNLSIRRLRGDRA